MKILLVPSAHGVGENQHQYLTSVLINDTVAIDVGCLGFYLTPQEQGLVRHVLISHSHVDHTASLPIFLENVFEKDRAPLTIHGNAESLESIQIDFFNDRLWPNLLVGEKIPFLKFQTIQSGVPLLLGDLKITPVEVNHVVPTLGFLVEDKTGAVVIATDTGPTQEIWDRANRTPNLKAIFLDASFPNSMTWLADLAKHLTPALFAQEVKKLTQPADIFPVHIKTKFFAEVVRELQALGLPQIKLAQYGKPYFFS